MNSGPKRRFKKQFKKWLQDERMVSPASRAAEFLFELRQRKTSKCKYSTFLLWATTATFQTEAWRRKHVTLILHTGTTQLAGGWSVGSPACRYTPVSTSHRHQLQELTHTTWLLYLRPKFNVVITISNSRILTFIVSFAVALAWLSLAWG